MQITPPYTFTHVADCVHLDLHTFWDVNVSIRDPVTCVARTRILNRPGFGIRPFVYFSSRLESRQASTNVLLDAFLIAAEMTNVIRAAWHYFGWPNSQKNGASHTVLVKS